MIVLEAIHKSNTRISELPEGLVALFLGATSGIGQSTLLQFSKYAVRPRVYIVARRASATSEILTELRAENPGGTYTIIEKDVSLVCETNEVVEFVKARENPRISFVHAYPGWVATSLFSKRSSGLLLLLMTWVVQPPGSLFAVSVDEAGARALFYCTSDRYLVSDGTGVPLTKGIEKSSQIPRRGFLERRKE